MLEIVTCEMRHAYTTVAAEDAFEVAEYIY